MVKQPQDRVNVTIDGHQIRVPAGTRILDAARDAGIEVPHYCYHPGLSAPAMCRMCLVEVEGQPKLQPACVTTVAEGQVVSTLSERALEARKGVLEFYLVNHPLDCPICDQSGECKLQDYVFEEGREHGRSFEGKRVFGKDDFGGGILYYGDRCIMCTRCVRFMDEIAADSRLCVVQRGDRSVIDTFFDERLDGSPWAGNIVDICPVGALVSTDFLHKARAWDLDSSPSICPNCTQGCNIHIQTRDGLVMRLKPRFNPEVNSFWICDYGRYRYEWLNRGARSGPTGDEATGLASAGDRVDSPMFRDSTGELRPHGWHGAISALLPQLKALRAAGASITVVASPFVSNEDAGLLARLLAVLGGGSALFRSSRAEAEIPCPGFPGLARRLDLAANVEGLRLLGYRRVGSDAGTGGLDEVAGEAGAIIVLGDELADQPAEFGRNARLFLYAGRFPTPATSNAHFILPVTTFAEQEGTFTNYEGRVQLFQPGLPVKGDARNAWQVFGVLLAGLGDSFAAGSAGEAFRYIAEGIPAYAGLDHSLLGAHGATVARTVETSDGGEDG